MESNQAEQMREKRIMQSKNRLRELGDSIKCKNVNIIEIPEKRKKGAENLFDEIIAENFPNLEKKTDILI